MMMNMSSTTATSRKKPIYPDIINLQKSLCHHKSLRPKAFQLLSERQITKRLKNGQNPQTGGGHLALGYTDWKVTRDSDFDDEKDDSIDDVRIGMVADVSDLRCEMDVEMFHVIRGEFEHRYQHIDGEMLQQKVIQRMKNGFYTNDITPQQIVQFIQRYTKPSHSNNGEIQLRNPNQFWALHQEFPIYQP